MMMLLAWFMLCNINGRMTVFSSDFFDPFPPVLRWFFFAYGPRRPVYAAANHVCKRPSFIVAMVLWYTLIMMATWLSDSEHSMHSPPFLIDGA